MKLKLTAIGILIASSAQAQDIQPITPAQGSAGRSGSSYYTDDKYHTDDQFNIYDEKNQRVGNVLNPPKPGARQPAPPPPPPPSFPSAHDLPPIQPQPQGYAPPPPPPAAGGMAPSGKQLRIDGSSVQNYKTTPENPRQIDIPQPAPQQPRTAAPGNAPLEPLESTFHPQGH